MDEPLVWYEGTGTSDRRWLHADERGSIVAVTKANGATLAKNAYDEYGIPASTNAGRFQYTGQQWLPELGMYHYKARIYSPTLGRFLQTDPIGYAGGMNLYAYAGGDPVNGRDPSGTESVCVTPTGSHIRRCVAVDGDGDGNAVENDLSPAESASIERSYFGFISTHGRGQDLSGYGKPVIGSDTEAAQRRVRVATQFVGYLASILRTLGDNNVTANHFRNAWASLTHIEVNTGGTGDAAYLADYPWASWIVITGSLPLSDSLSDIARILLHEPWHRYVVSWEDQYYSLHAGVDDWARSLLMDSGLGGGGCIAGPGFPACE